MCGRPWPTSTRRSWSTSRLSRRPADPCACWGTGPCAGSWSPPTSRVPRPVRGPPGWCSPTDWRWPRWRPFTPTRRPPSRRWPRRGQGGRGPRRPPTTTTCSGSPPGDRRVVGRAVRGPEPRALVEARSDQGRRRPRRQDGRRSPRSRQARRSDGRRHPGADPGQRDRARVRPRHPPASRARVGAEGPRQHAGRPDLRHRRATLHGLRRPDPGGPAARAPPRARHDRGRHGGRRRRRRRGRPQGRPRLARHGLRRPGGDPAQGRRPAGRAVAADAERGHDARAVQDRLPGRDRLGLRADRLLAVQRRLRPADHGGAADLVARGVEPRRLPTA